MTALGSIGLGAEKRRTTRVAKRVAITVSGIDALQQPFIIATHTLSVSCHGCRYKSKHYIPKHSMVTIEISGAEFPSRLASGRVVWVQRPRSVNQEFEIGLEFDTPHNAWGEVEPLPEDWLPFCNHPAAATPSLDGENAALRKLPAGTESYSVAFAPTCAVEQTEARARQAEGRDGQLYKTIEQAIYRSIERTTEAVAREALLQLPRKLAPAIAKKVCQDIRHELDILVQDAVRKAVKGSQVKVSTTPR